MESNKNLFIFNFKKMRKLFKKIIVFSIPFVIYLVIVLIVDPYRYYKDNKIVDLELKEKIAKKIEPHLYKIIDFKNNPKRNILLGDSRSNRLYENISERSDYWASLAYGAGSLHEVLMTFDWIKQENLALDTIIVGLNFNLYNKYNKRTWLEETIERKKNIFSYAFSSYAAKSTFLILKESILGENIEIGKPKISKELFWKRSVKNYGDKFYKRYGYPDKNLEMLKSMSKYCDEKNINLIFWIPPCSKELNTIVDDYSLTKERQQFYEDLKALGKVYNFNLYEFVVNNNDNFTDPAHFNFETGNYIYDVIFKSR